MLRVGASAARQHFFDLLNAVEQGEEVVVERRGVHFRLVLAQPSEPSGITESPLVVEGPRLLEDDWTWHFEADGDLSFRHRDE